MTRDVWVLADHADGRPRKIAAELLRRGRELAGALGGRVVAVALGSGLDAVGSVLGSYGADEVLLADDPRLAQYTTDAYAAVLAPLLAAEQPYLLLIGSTAMGRDLAPRLAARLGAGVVTDCAAVDWDGEQVVTSRPVMTRKAIARVAFTGNVLRIAVVLPKVYPPASQDVSRAVPPRAVAVPPDASEERVAVLEVQMIKRETLPLTEADVIVAGGRGLGGAENFALLHQLADALGGAVGSSWPPVASGWVPHDYEIGQTGKTVTPQLYIACGISGALQHLAGMSSARCIVAINTDPAAPIFGVASYGIVADAAKIVPLLTEEIRRRKAIPAG
jgi:electron transfer flavoprotein alpha subunit